MLINKKGFSLIELLLVISVIVGLSIIAFNVYSKLNNKAIAKKINEDIVYAFSEYENGLNFPMSYYKKSKNQSGANINETDALPLLNSRFRLISEKSTNSGAEKIYDTALGFNLKLITGNTLNNGFGDRFIYSIEKIKNPEVCISVIMQNKNIVDYVSIGGRKFISEGKSADNISEKEKINPSNIAYFCGSNKKGATIDFVFNWRK